MTITMAPHSKSSLTMTTRRSLLVALLALIGSAVQGFTTSKPFSSALSRITFNGASASSTSLSMSDDFATADDPQERIQSLVDNHPVLLFMKGSKLFPQCGFSNTATQILNSFGIDYHTIDVLADDGIRQGVKEFSQWPTIPQLYVCGDFVGGSDIMLEMYQNGELGEMIEKAKADMI